MTQKHVYQVLGDIEITELVYEYGEEDPVDEIEMKLEDLTKKERSTLEYAVEHDGSLVEYLPKDSSLYGIIDDIQIGVNEFGSCTTVVSTALLNEAQETELLDYINGQFSDGWGEGFHQHPFYEEEKVLIADFQSTNSLKNIGIGE